MGKYLSYKYTQRNQHFQWVRRHLSICNTNPSVLQTAEKHFGCGLSLNSLREKKKAAKKEKEVGAVSVVAFIHVLLTRKRKTKLKIFPFTFNIWTLSFVPMLILLNVKAIFDSYRNCIIAWCLELFCNSVENPFICSGKQAWIFFSLKVCYVGLWNLDFNFFTGSHSQTR